MGEATSKLQCYDINIDTIGIQDIFIITKMLYMTLS
jgi:hypothetical protein